MVVYGWKVIAREGWRVNEGRVEGFVVAAFRSGTTSRNPRPVQSRRAVTECA